MNKRDVDEDCTFILNSLRDLNRNLAGELTEILKEPQYKPLTKEQRKIAKVRLLIERDFALFHRIIGPKNIAWFGEARSPTNFFDILDRKSNELNIFGELTGGNFSGKV